MTLGVVTASQSNEECIMNGSPTGAACSSEGVSASRSEPASGSGSAKSSNQKHPLLPVPPLNKPPERRAKTTKPCLMRLLI